MQREHYILSIHDIRASRFPCHIIYIILVNYGVRILHILLLFLFVTPFVGTSCKYISIFHRLVRHGHKLQLISTSASRNTQLSVGIDVYLFDALYSHTLTIYSFLESLSKFPTSNDS